MAKLPFGKKEQPGNDPQIQVNHGNAPLLMVKFLELIHKELKAMNEKLDKLNA